MPWPSCMPVPHDCGTLGSVCCPDPASLGSSQYGDGTNGQSYCKDEGAWGRCGTRRCLKQQLPCEAMQCGHAKQFRQLQGKSLQEHAAQGTAWPQRGLCPAPPWSSIFCRPGLRGTHRISASVRWSHSPALPCHAMPCHAMRSTASPALRSHSFAVLYICLSVYLSIHRKTVDTDAMRCCLPACQGLNHAAGAPSLMQSASCGPPMQPAVGQACAAAPHACKKLRGVLSRGPCY